MSVNSFNSGSHRTLKIVCVVLCCLLLLSAVIALFFVFKSDDSDSVSVSNIVLTSSDPEDDEIVDSLVFLSFDYLDSADSTDSFVASVSFTDPSFDVSVYFWSVEVDSSYEGYSAGGGRWLGYGEINYLDYFSLDQSMYSCTVTCLNPFGCRFRLCYHCCDSDDNWFYNYCYMDYYSYFDSVEIHVYDEDMDNGYGQFYEDLLTATLYVDGRYSVSYSNYLNSSLSCEVSLFNVCFCDSLRPFVEITSFGYTLGSVLYDIGDPYLCVDLMYLDDLSLSSFFTWTLAFEECTGISFSDLTPDFFDGDAVFSIRISPFSDVVFDVLVYFSDFDWLTEDSVTYSLDFTDSSSVPDSVLSYCGSSVTDVPSALCIEKNFIYYFDYTSCGVYSLNNYFGYSLQTSVLDNYVPRSEYVEAGTYVDSGGVGGYTEQFSDFIEFPDEISYFSGVPEDSPWKNGNSYLTNYFLFDFARLSSFSDFSVTVYFSPMFEGCSGSVFLFAYGTDIYSSQGLVSMSLDGCHVGQVYSVSFSAPEFLTAYFDEYLYFMYQDPLYILGFEITMYSPFSGDGDVSNVDWGELYPSIGSVADSVFVVNLDFSDTSTFIDTYWRDESLDYLDVVCLDKYGIVYFADYDYVSEISSGYIDVCDPQYSGGSSGRSSSDLYIYFDFSAYIGSEVTLTIECSSSSFDDLVYAGLVDLDGFNIFLSDSSFDYSSCFASGSGSYVWVTDYIVLDEETGDSYEIGHIEPSFSVSFTFTVSYDFSFLYFIWSSRMYIFDIEISIV